MGVIVITGNGKGKTTSALGLAMLAQDTKGQAAIVQFLKGNSYAGELFAAQRAGLEIYQFGWGCPWSSLIRNGSKQCDNCGECFRENRRPEHGFAAMAMECAVRLAGSGSYGLLVLDEISHALRRELLTEQVVLDFLLQYRSRMDIVLTGRQMAAAICQVADFVYELKDIKHPLRSGIASRRGVEY
ncbi:MAG: cob(I)yrinic acid a,c-diamide adenosyltransferase [Peptococcaceae bacterium]|nr:cob(I)yrinic acid a,c-diamide adenosyltransferase [Peptococcaceae bacterium]